MRRAPRRRPLLGSLAVAGVLQGCDVRFGAVEYLWGLWAIPVLLAFYVYAFRTKRRLITQFVSPEMLGRLTAGVSHQRQVLKAALVLAGFALGVFSLAQLKYGFTWEQVRRQGVDIVVALDVSDSMLVEDAESGGKLSRLERAKREITDLLKLMDGDRIALVAFAGTAFVECPLTLDYGAAAVFLDDIDTELIPVPGTAID
ncbi:MAG TPA: VWA domain-containing protein, partial [Myxococcota bacterium]|nr:VWA domain-containing protein [Myxococcota bacterium]